MEEKTLPWWRKALSFALDGIRSGFGLFSRPQKARAASEPELAESASEFRVKETVVVEDSLKLSPVAAQVVAAPGTAVEAGLLAVVAEAIVAHEPEVEAETEGGVVKGLVVTEEPEVHTSGTEHAAEVPHLQQGTEDSISGHNLNRASNPIEPTRPVQGVEESGPDGGEGFNPRGMPGELKRASAPEERLPDSSLEFGPISATAESEPVAESEPQIAVEAQPVVEVKQIPVEAEAITAAEFSNAIEPESPIVADAEPVAEVEQHAAPEAVDIEPVVETVPVEVEPVPLSKPAAVPIEELAVEPVEEQSAEAPSVNEPDLIDDPEQQVEVIPVAQPEAEIEPESVAKAEPVVEMASAVEDPVEAPVEEAPEQAPQQAAAEEAESSSEEPTVSEQAPVVELVVEAEPEVEPEPVELETELTEPVMEPVVDESREQNLTQDFEQNEEQSGDQPAEVEAETVTEVVASAEEVPEAAAELGIVSQSEVAPVAEPVAEPVAVEAPVAAPIVVADMPAAAAASAPVAQEPEPVAEESEPVVAPPAKPLIKLTTRDNEADLSPFSVIVEQVYDGPLDLLLDLIRKQDIDIYDIPIAKITAQFLAYVNQLKATDVDVAGEFIYIASLLIHIKSKMLLPRSPSGPDDAAEDPRRELVERLLEHERFKNAAQMLQQKQMLEAATWTNPGLREFQDDAAAEPEIAADTVDLVRIFRDILERARTRPVINLEEDSVTVGQMIQFLARRLTMEDKPVALRRLLSHTRSERALIAMFLALLELVRLQAILLRQDRAFSDIFIKKHVGFENAMNEGMANARDDWR